MSTWCVDRSNHEQSGAPGASTGAIRSNQEQSIATRSNQEQSRAPGASTGAGETHSCLSPPTQATGRAGE